MKIKHTQPKKTRDWDRLEVTAEPGKRLWIDSQATTPQKITIWEEPEERGDDHDRVPLP